MSSTATTSSLSPAEGYRHWAQTYDDEPNPMLFLERRILEPLLPPLRNLEIVDLGCGTGRWLEILKRLGACNLLGVDLSPEMLGIAESKLAGVAKTARADCATVPLPKASADLLFCNFVLSYVEDADHFLKLASKALRPGGSLFLTDIHPATATTLHWRRGVRIQDEFQEIRTQHRTIAEVISLCEKANLNVAILLEPLFGEAERTIFEKNGKRGYFDTISHLPAIYVLQVCAPDKPPAVLPQKGTSATLCGIYGARFALGPTDSFQGEMSLSDCQIESLHTKSHTYSWDFPGETSLDLQGFLVLPGLINAHDHLEFALFPRLGNGGYQNFLQWADDIHHLNAPTIAQQRQVPREARLWWGGIRNLLCGVTTVCHHNPFEPEVFTDQFIVRVLRDYGWAHSFPLDPAAAQKKKGTLEGQPFFIHLAEGIDQKSAEEIFELNRAGALDADTVIIHGLGLGKKGSALLRKSGAGLIWCPSSNLFLFGETLPSDQINSFGNVALGSDSPLTAAGDLLDEVRCACNALNASPADLYSYITHRAAALLRLQRGEGKFRVGGLADLIAVRDTGMTPAETLVTLSYRDVQLVLLGGRVQLASAELIERLPQGVRAGLYPLSIEGVVRWIRAPLEWLFAGTEKHFDEDIRLAGKRIRYGS